MPGGPQPNETEGSSLPIDVFKSNLEEYQKLLKLILELGETISEQEVKVDEAEAYAASTRTDLDRYKESRDAFIKQVETLQVDMRNILNSYFDSVGKILG